MKRFAKFAALVMLMINVALGLNSIVSLDIPVYTGDINKVEYRVILEGEDYLVVEINGERYIVLKPK